MCDLKDFRDKSRPELELLESKSKCRGNHAVFTDDFKNDNTVNDAILEGCNRLYLQSLRKLFLVAEK